jgi:hypothetical protein
LRQEPKNLNASGNKQDPPDLGKSAEEKMDDMAKIIKDLSNKISRMELDQAKPDPFARKYFRRNPNPQTQQRQVKNEDQKIQAPFKTENFIGDDIHNYEGLEEDINNLSDEDQEPHLTRQDYEISLDQEPLFSNEESINNLGESAYQGITDSIMVELQQKYNLRPRETNTTNGPPKNILSRNKVNEAVVTKPLVEKQVCPNQNS